eukprot:916984-Pelagomonas_calceolata.AAC.7
MGITEVTEIVSYHGACSTFKVWTWRWKRATLHTTCLGKAGVVSREFERAHVSDTAVFVACGMPCMSGSCSRGCCTE